MKIPHEEWLRQAEYDMGTAECMLRTGRRIYAVFMCHLALEKTLKGLYQARRDEIPPRTHSLVRLMESIGIEPPEPARRFVGQLDSAHVTTRYPQELTAIQAQYTEGVTAEILHAAKEFAEWIRKQF